MTREIDVSSSAVSAVSALPLLLAVQDGFITLSSRGPVTLGNIFRSGVAAARRHGNDEPERRAG
jgi:hypothetical protein